MTGRVMNAFRLAAVLIPLAGVGGARLMVVMVGFLAGAAVVIALATGVRRTGLIRRRLLVRAVGLPRVLLLGLVRLLLALV